MIGVLAPEMVAFTAWAQRATAIKLTNDMNGALSKRKDIGQDID